MALPPALRSVAERWSASPAWPAAHLLRWLWLFYAELRQDRAFARAAGMAYATVIALVPSLVLVTALASAVGVLGEDPEATIRAVLHPLVGQVPAAGAFLVDGLLRVDLRSLSAVALAGLVLVASRLFLSVELAYHDILGQPIARSWPQRLAGFWVAVTCVPIALVVAVRAGLEGAFAPDGGTWTLPLVGPALLFVLLVGALKFLPSTPIRWSAALAGATASFFLTELGRRAFEAYIQVFGAEDPLLAIYGSIALLPVFLLWLYLFWVFILLGVEVANVVQNHSTLSEAEFEVEEGDRFPTVDLALRVAVLVGARFQDRLGATSLEALTSEIQVSPRQLRTVVAVLERAGLLVPTAGGYLLSRPPDQTRVGEVVALWFREAALPLRDADPSRADARARAEVVSLLSTADTLTEVARRWSEAPPRAASSGSEDWGPAGWAPAAPSRPVLRRDPR